MIRHYLIFSLFLSFINFNTFADSNDSIKTEKTTLKFKSYSQLYFSYSQNNNDTLINPYGFTIRRLRFITQANLTPNIVWKCQIGCDRRVIRLLDIYVNFQIKNYFQLRVGQTVIPTSRAAVSDNIFSTTKMALIERPLIVRKFLANNGLYVWRALGIKAYGSFFNKKIHYGLMIANAENGSLFTPSLSNTINNHNNVGLTYRSQIAFKPIKEISLGGFSGYSNYHENDTINIKKSYGIHFFLRKYNLSVFSEFINGNYKKDTQKTDFSGFYIDLAYRIKKTEPAFRYDFYTPNKHNTDDYWVRKYINYTIGINYYLNEKVKFQFNYVLKKEQMQTNYDELDNNLAYLCFQYVF